jgi:hypothetical protein
MERNATERKRLKRRWLFSVLLTSELKIKKERTTEYIKLVMYANRDKDWE